MKRLTINQVINKVDEVPALPNVVSKIVQLIEDPDSTPYDIEAAILKDQGLTAKALRLANSAYYGYPRQISTISKATILLGFETMRSIILSASVNKMLTCQVPGYKMGKGELWHHSQAVAIIARHIARIKDIKNSEQIYVAGLLHDIGKVIMGHFVEDIYAEFIDTVIDIQMSFLQAEEELLGFNHAQIGAKIAKKWNLSPSLIEAIKYHHSPSKATIDPYATCTTHIADAIAMMMGIGLGIDGMAYSVSDYAMEVLDLHVGTEIDDIMTDAFNLLCDENCFDSKIK